MKGNIYGVPCYLERNIKRKIKNINTETKKQRKTKKNTVKEKKNRTRIGK